MKKIELRSWVASFMTRSDIPRDVSRFLGEIVNALPEQPTLKETETQARQWNIFKEYFSFEVKRLEEKIDNPPFPRPMTATEVLARLQGVELNRRVGPKDRRSERGRSYRKGYWDATNRLCELMKWTPPHKIVDRRKQCS